MTFKVPRINLDMVDVSKATSTDRLIIQLTSGEVETGQLVLQLCDHAEGKGRKFCLDSESYHVSLTEKLRIGGYIARTGPITYFPHISVVGPFNQGDRPHIEIYSDPRLQRRYVLSALIGRFDTCSIGSFTHQRLLATA